MISGPLTIVELCFQGQQARLRRSVLSLVLAAASAVAAAVSVWGISWAIGHGESVLMVSLVLAGGAAAALALTSFWSSLRRRAIQIDTASNTIRLSKDRSVNFQDISAIRLRSQDCDFYGEKLTFYQLELVPRRGEAIALAEDDDAVRLAEVGKKLAKLVDCPLQDSL